MKLDQGEDTLPGAQLHADCALLGRDMPWANFVGWMAIIRKILGFFKKSKHDNEQTKSKVGLFREPKSRVASAYNHFSTNDPAVGTSENLRRQLGSTSKCKQHA